VTMVNLPEVNTPQFDWVLNKLPERPQPVPPIYPVDLMAQALVHASEHPRRRAWWISSPTVWTILGNKVWPQFLDRYLARNGYEGQQRGEKASPDDPVNLWEPADGRDGRDFGARSSFRHRTRNRDPQIWASRHHGTLAAAGAGLVATALAARRRDR
jgi:hypothetical protein